MSAKGIQKKIDNAHKKIGKTLGYTYGIYRPLNSNVDVISDRNFIKSVKATVTLNDSYSNNIRWEIPLWKLYSESAELEVGDYLYSEDEGRTFFVLIKQPHQPVFAVEANDRINISSVGYGDGGTGFGPGQVNVIAKNLPCYLSYGTDAVQDDLPGRGLGKRPFRTMSVITALPRSTMLLGETLLDTDGFKGDVVGYDFNSVGCGVRIHVAERGFPHAG